MLSKSQFEKLNIAVGKCFAKSQLNEEDIQMLLNYEDEVLNMGLTMDQIRLIKLWCQRECQRSWAQSYMTGSSEDRQQHCSPYSKYSYRGYRT